MPIIYCFAEQVQELFSFDNQLICTLVLLIVLDYITGVCFAIQTHQLSSDIGSKGITRKIAIFIVIAFCHILDAYLIEDKSVLETISTGFYLSNEAISIFENLNNLGVPLPNALKRVLSNIKNGIDEDS